MMFADDIIDFNPGPQIDNHISSGGNDAFLCKYDSSGTYLWGLDWGSIVTNDAGKGLAIDGTTAVYVAGLFEGIVDFDPGPVTEHHTSNGSIDAFLSKFDLDPGPGYALQDDYSQPGYLGFVTKLRPDGYW